MSVSLRPTSRPSALPLPAPRSLRASNAGSALVLVLLVVALLTTTVVGFLSTARIEQLAARNFSQQNAAAGLAELATQQAMAKISLGFNTAGDLTGNYTSVVTTQPGAIHKFFFQNGNVTQNTTVELFSSGNLMVNSNSTALGGNSSDEIINMNNLSNPSGTETSNLTITGNPSEQINVAMEDVEDSEGNLVGRIAFYVDDELTKININGATGNRTTLNVSTPRSISLSALTSNNSTLGISSNQISDFEDIIDGSGNDETSITNWSHFFRNEQLSSNSTLNATASQLAQFSTAPLSDFHLKYTPWGDTRLHINDVPLDSSGVEDVYAALSSPHLTNIYGQNFNDKYGQNWSWTGNYGQTANTTVNGLKQTIANMLQMRTPAHHDRSTVENGYTGPVISENGTTEFPPSGYYAHVPSGILNEFAIKIDYNTVTEQIYIKPFIEISCPFAEAYGGGAVHIEVKIQSITYMTAGNASNTVGPFTLTSNVNLSDYLGDSNHAFHKCTFNSKKFNASVPIGPPVVQIVDNVPSGIIGNPTVTMGDVKLYAGTSASSDALRDWLEGSFINEKLGNGSFLTVNTPLNIASDIDENNYKANFNSSNESLQRIDPRIKGKTAWVKAPNTFSIVAGSIVNKGRGPRSSDLQGGHNTQNSGYGLKPVESATSDIPGDPSSRGVNDADFYTASEFSAVYFMQKLHTLDAASTDASQTNATFNTPHDLGKVPTNVNWRRLRFMPRHKNENTKNLIPDWAMLDVMSFSSNNSSRSNLKIAPINPHGSFALDSTINNSTTIPSPRNNLEALIKPLESSSPTNFKLRSAIARSGAGENMEFDIQDLSVEGHNYVKFRGANAALATSIASNITSNSTAKWSTLNSTWSGWRTSRGWPSTSLVLPGEVTEIIGVADYAPRSPYLFTVPNQNNRSIKENEGRLTAFFPGLTLQSNFFSIYAYAQALDTQGNIDSEALTKTLVEVEVETPATATTPAVYKVKKLYTQPIQLGK